MRVFRVIPACVFFILFGGQVVVVPTPAYSWCCQLPACTGACTKCGGTCYACCGRRSIETFQNNLLTTNDTLDNANVQDPLPQSVRDLDIKEASAELTRGAECIRRSFTLWMLGNPEDSMTFASIMFEGPVFQNRTLASQVE